MVKSTDRGYTEVCDEGYGSEGSYALPFEEPSPGNSKLISIVFICCRRGLAGEAGGTDLVNDVKFVLELFTHGSHF